MSDLSEVERRAALRAIAMAMSEGGWEWEDDESQAVEALIRKLGGTYHSRPDEHPQGWGWTEVPRTASSSDGESNG